MLPCGNMCNIHVQTRPRKQNLSYKAEYLIKQVHYSAKQSFWDISECSYKASGLIAVVLSRGLIKQGLVCWSLTSLCHSNRHIETMLDR